MTSIYTLTIMPKASVDTLMPEFALHCLTGMIYLPNRRVIYASFIAANSKHRPFVIMLICTSRKIPIWLKRCKDWRWYLLPGTMYVVFISFWSMSAVFPVFVIICILCHILYLWTVMLLMSFYFLHSRKLMNGRSQKYLFHDWALHNCTPVGICGNNRKRFWMRLVKKMSDNINVKA